MVRRIQAHFDGRVIVPDEPLDLPAGTAVAVELAVEETTAQAEKRAALTRLLGRGLGGLNIPDEALRREAMYGEE